MTASTERSGCASAKPVAVVVPARNEAQRMPANVAAARRLPEVGVVIVVDDGSADATAEVARAAGALVVAHPRLRGKASAMETGADLASLLDQHDGLGSQRHLLFLDADLEHTAANSPPLEVPVLAGAADMAIAIQPPAASPGGGHGLWCDWRNGGSPPAPAGRPPSHCRGNGA